MLSPSDQFTITRGELLDLVCWNDQDERGKIVDKVLASGRQISAYRV